MMANNNYSTEFINQQLTDTLDERLNAECGERGVLKFAPDNFPEIKKGAITALEFQWGEWYAILSPADPAYSALQKYGMETEWPFIDLTNDDLAKLILAVEAELS